MAALALGVPQLGHPALYPSAAYPWSSSTLSPWKRRPAVVAAAAAGRKLSAKTSRDRMSKRKMRLISLEGPILERIITTPDEDGGGGGGMSESEAEDHHHHQAGLLSTQGSSGAASIANGHRGRIEIADRTVDERRLAVVQVRRLRAARNANQEAGVGARVARHRLRCSFRLRQIPCRRSLGTGRWDGDGVRLRRCLRYPAHGSQAQERTSRHPRPRHLITSLYRLVVDSLKSNLATKPAAAPVRAPRRHPLGTAVDPWGVVRLAV